MDEVFDSSLDGFGTDEFLKIIRYIIKDANIFVISHKQDMRDKFESVIMFDKVKGFRVKFLQTPRTNGYSQLAAPLQERQEAHSQTPGNASQERGTETI